MINEYFEVTKTDVIRQICNAVPVNTARNLFRAALIKYIGATV
jgi:site-specific DNA-cytosine methylase